MDQTLKSILRVLEEGKPEHRVAAAQILGALQPKEAAVARGLADQLSHEDGFLSPFVLDALAAIGSAEATAVLVAKLDVGGSLGERVAHLLGQMGANVSKALAEAFDDAGPELRARILEVLGRHQDREALTLLKKAVLHGDDQLSETAAGVLADHLPSLEPKLRDYLKQGLERSLAAKSAASLEPWALARGIALLGELDGESNRTLLLRLATAKHDPLVRQAALQALRGVTLTAAQRRTLLGYVGETDMTHVVRPAMRLLEGADGWTAPGIAQLEELLESRSEERRLFALRGLRDHQSEALAKRCIKLLLSGNPEFQAAARDALSRNEEAVDQLLRAFQLEKNVERARLLAEPLAALGAFVTVAQRKSLTEKAAKLVTAGEPLGDVVLDLLLAIDEEQGVKQLVDKAVRLRRARRLPECMMLLARLAQTDRISDEGRYQLGVARLIADRGEARDDRRGAGDATMGYFAMLVRNGFSLIDRLKREGQLEPDDLFRIGRHFAQAVGVERRFGADLLHHVADKHPRRKVGEEAKLALRSEGL